MECAVFHFELRTIIMPNKKAIFNKECGIH